MHAGQIVPSSSFSSDCKGTDNGAVQGKVSLLHPISWGDGHFSEFPKTTENDKNIYNPSYISLNWTFQTRILLKNRHRTAIA